ncbi:hypothetical protein [Streptomyces mirabilis]|uniref:hypothetical protein n=1 Tax=Streptomyces mirabilis TaxID=68239 RepID=UPI00369D7311
MRTRSLLALLGTAAALSVSAIAPASADDTPVLTAGGAAGAPPGRRTPPQASGTPPPPDTTPTPPPPTRGSTEPRAGSVTVQSPVG